MSDYPSMSHVQHITFEGNDCVVMSPEEYGAALADLEAKDYELSALRAELAELRARVPAICFPRQPKCDIAEVIVDQVENWLSDSVPSDDFIIDVTEEQKDALNSIVWEWFYKNVSPKHWTVTDVHQHEAAILAAKEKGQ